MPPRSTPMTQLVCDWAPTWGLPPYPSARWRTRSRPYKVYRSRPRLLARSATATTRWPSCARPRSERRTTAPARGPPPPRRAAAPTLPGAAARSARRSAAASGSAPGRVLRWVLARARRLGRRSRRVLFMVSAQIQRGDLADEVGPQLERRPLPADRREHDPRARLRRAHRATSPSPAARARRAARTRSCCCGSAAAPTRRSRSRATRSSTSPATGRNKINAAYAFGGPALATQTVKEYLGIEINHVVEVSFENFPAADRRARRRHLQGRLPSLSKINGGNAQRRLHAAPAQGRDGDRRQAGARARPHAQEPAQPGRGRPRPARAASSSSSPR